jgi:acetylornithine deacetylase
MTEKNVIDILKSLVGFDTTSFKSNLDLIAFIKNYLNIHKIKSTLVYDSSGKKANLYATIGSSSEGGIMLSGHTDIVPITDQAWTYDPFHLTQKDNKLYGRGTADMKGFLALILSRVPKMISANLSKPIHLAFSYDEEVGCVGVHRLLDFINSNSIKPVFCIVGEPTSMEVVIGHKGKCAYQVVVKGLACHSGQAPFGVNAVDYAAKLISYIAEIAKEKSIKGPFDYDYEVPYSTLHTGVISGGTILNIVPDSCQFEFEIRHLIEDNPKELINKIKLYAKENLLPNMHIVSSKTDIHFKEKVTYPGLLIDANSEPVRYVKKLLNNEKHKKVIFGSEGGLFQKKLNLPTVVCGPGSIDQAHKANEYISIDQLEKGGKFLDDLINFCR